MGEIVEGKVSITLAALKGSMTGVWHIGSATGATLARVDANVEREAHAGQEPREQVPYGRVVGLLAGGLGSTGRRTSSA